MKDLTNFLLRSMILFVLGGQMSLSLADEDHDEARRLHESGEILSLEVILQRLRPRYPGKVLEVELERKSGRIIYEVEMLGKDGVVRELYIDARTGEVLRSKVDD